MVQIKKWKKDVTSLANFVSFESSDFSSKCLVGFGSIDWEEVQLQNELSCLRAARGPARLDLFSNRAKFEFES